MTKSSQSQNGSILIVGIIILVVALLGALGYFAWTNVFKATDEVTQQETKEQTTKEQVIKDSYEGWLTCVDRSDNVSFKYPSDWEVIVSEKNPCNSLHPEPGENFFTLFSPGRKDTPNIFRLTFFSDVQPNNAQTKSTQKILYTDELEISSAPTALYMFASAESGNEIAGFGITDSETSVGQQVEGTLGITGHLNELGRTYQLSVDMTRSKAQQYATTYNLGDIQSHPDYKDVVKIFESLEYL